MSDRPDIPSAIKLQVRRACGFGCVLCGSPVFHYDHIVDYAEVLCHEADNLALLCPTHHQDKTSKRMPREVVRGARDNPINVRNPRTAPHRWYMTGGEAVITLGSNKLVHSFSEGDEYFAAVKINENIIFGVRNIENQLLMDLVLQDRYGNDVFLMKDGEVTLDTGVGDYNITGRSIQIKDKDMKLIADLRIDGNGINIIHGEFWMEPVGIVIADSQVTVYPYENSMQDCTSHSMIISDWVYPRAANDKRY